MDSIDVEEWYLPMNAVDDIVSFDLPTELELAPAGDFEREVAQLNNSEVVLDLDSAWERCLIQLRDHVDPTYCSDCSGLYALNKIDRTVHVVLVDLGDGLASFPSALLKDDPLTESQLEYVREYVEAFCQDSVKAQQATARLSWLRAVVRLGVRIRQNMQKDLEKLRTVQQNFPIGKATKEKRLRASIARSLSQLCKLLSQTSEEGKHETIAELERCLSSDSRPEPDSDDGDNPTDEATSLLADSDEAGGRSKQAATQSQRVSSAASGGGGDGTSVGGAEDGEEQMPVTTDDPGAIFLATQPPWVCKLCNKTCPDKKNMNEIHAQSRGHKAKLRFLSLTPPYGCTLCDVKATSMACLAEHVLGTKHAQKVVTYTTGHPEATADLLPRPVPKPAAPPGDGVPGRQWLSTQPPWECKLCNKTCTSERDLLESHAKGQEHGSRVAVAKAGPSSSPTASPPMLLDAAKQQPAPPNQQPASAKQQPASAKQQPALAKQQPALAKQQPASAKQQPAPANPESPGGDDALPGQQYLSSKSPWKCYLCDVCCTSWKNLVMHARGQAHLTALKAVSLKPVVAANGVEASAEAARTALGGDAVSPPGETAASHADPFPTPKPAGSSASATAASTTPTAGMQPTVPGNRKGGQLVLGYQLEEFVRPAKACPNAWAGLGQCSRGEHCQQYHICPLDPSLSLNDLRLFKTVPCSLWGSSGFCKRGVLCRYAHGDKERLNAWALFRQPPMTLYGRATPAKGASAATSQVKAESAVRNATENHHQPKSPDEPEPSRKAPGGRKAPQAPAGQPSASAPPSAAPPHLGSPAAAKSALPSAPASPPPGLGGPDLPPLLQLDDGEDALALAVSYLPHMSRKPILDRLLLLSSTCQQLHAHLAGSEASSAGRIAALEAQVEMLMQDRDGNACHCDLNHNHQQAAAQNPVAAASGGAQAASNNLLSPGSAGSKQCNEQGAGQGPPQRTAPAGRNGAAGVPARTAPGEGPAPEMDRQTPGASAQQAEGQTTSMQRLLQSAMEAEGPAAKGSKPRRFRDESPHSGRSDPGSVAHATAGAMQAATGIRSMPSSIDGWEGGRESGSESWMKMGEVQANGSTSRKLPGGEGSGKWPASGATKPAADGNGAAAPQGMQVAGSQGHLQPAGVAGRMQQGCIPPPTYGAAMPAAPQMGAASASTSTWPEATPAAVPSPEATGQAAPAAFEAANASAFGAVQESFGVSQEGFGSFGAVQREVAFPGGGSCLEAFDVGLPDGSFAPPVEAAEGQGTHSSALMPAAFGSFQDSSPLDSSACQAAREGSVLAILEDAGRRRGGERAATGMMLIGGVQQAEEGVRIEEYTACLNMYVADEQRLYSLPDLPQAFGNGAAAVLGSGLYVVGGGPSPSALSADLMRLDLQTGAWTWGSSLAVKRGSLGLAAVGQHLYACGGGGPREQHCTAECYDVGADSWLRCPPMRWNRFATAAVELGGAIHVVGGYGCRVGSSSGRCLMATERFDPREGKWTDLADMSGIRMGHSCTVVEGRIMALGGFNGRSLEAVEIFDPRAGAWLPGPPMRNERCYHCSMSTADGLYVIGGFTPGSQGTDHNMQQTWEVLHSGSSVWEDVELPPHVVPRMCFMAGVCVTTNPATLAPN